MKVTCSELMDEMVDREAIRHCLMRYCRGIDRMDTDLVRSVYWPDAHDAHLEFSGSPEAFIEWCFPLMQSMDQTMHSLSNILISIDGDRADVESYFHAFHRLKATDNLPERDVVVAGRYLDQFQKRNDEWRILDRVVILDWFREYADSADWSAGPLGMKVAPGRRKPDDPSYRLSGLCF